MSSTPIHLLLVDDNPGDARLIMEAIADVHQIQIGVTYVGLLKDAIQSVNDAEPDVILLDLSLPDSQGAITVERMYALCPQVPIVIITGLDDEEFAVQLIGKMAQDYLVKGQLDGKSLVRAMRYAIERKRAEAYRLALQIERERTRLFKQFTTDVSHDLRTPITIINTSLYLLRSLTVSERQLHFIDSVETQAGRIQNITEDFFTLTKLEESADHPSFEPCDLKTLLEDICEQQQGVILKKHHTLTLSFDSTLLEINAHNPEFNLMVKQILLNALNYTPDGGEISVRTYLQDDQAVIAISDNGIGISTEDMPHIYERFFRADKARSMETGGTGLGLSIARRIVEIHEGRLWADSCVGKGSTFYVSTPLLEKVL